jgi:adenylate cyclase
MPNRSEDMTNPEEITPLQPAELLLSISKRVAAYETLDDMLKILVDMVTEEIAADRATIFLNDPDTGELFSRVAHGDLHREIRILNTSGVVGHVFNTGKGAIVHDAYSDERFNRAIDQTTGYKTESILCVPIKTVRGQIIGAAQVLNKNRGPFTDEDIALVEAMVMQAAILLQSGHHIERMQTAHKKEMAFIDTVADLTTEIDLSVLLRKVMTEATNMLNSERSTLFLNDEKPNELFSLVGEGLETSEIRFPNHLGIAGTVFSTGVSVIIPHAYADLRFNPSFDKQTGFFTRSILCVPVVNKTGKTIGVTQVLNKKGGPFTDQDEARLKAFTSQVAIALENAKLFDDIQNMKNYNESILESMSNGVITLNEEGEIITCNASGLRILGVLPEDIHSKNSKDFFVGPNTWVQEKVLQVETTRNADVTMDADLEFNDKKLSVNLTALPLSSIEKKKLGTMIMIEDISSEKRMKSTLSRYMDPRLAGRLLGGGEDLLGGKSTTATVLFSDIRGFTPLTEELGAQGIVALLNEYFTIMVDCIQQEGGMLDKFIGDAIMAAFGIPIIHDDDEDRAVRTAISMLNHLAEWNAARLADGKKPVDIGVGLSTDTVTSGNIGSPKRMDYTLIGDGVNLASRLESACKQYATHILISETTYLKLRGTYRVREVDRVLVKGKRKPVSIYEVLDYHTDDTFPNLMEAVNYFKEGLASYRAQEWEKAIKSFSDSLDANEQDKLSRIYIRRCEQMKLTPPGDDWDGVWVMTSK